MEKREKTCINNVMFGQNKEKKISKSWPNNNNNNNPQNINDFKSRKYFCFDHVFFWPKAKLNQTEKNKQINKPLFSDHINFRSNLFFT